MSRIVYVNGEYVSEGEARISVFDRGLLFADSVYEVTSVLKGKLVDWRGHHKRLERSMKELSFEWKCDEEFFLKIHKQIIKKNNLDEGTVYLQITRGIADRDFTFDKTIQPSIIAFSQQKKIIEPLLTNKGLSVMTAADIRWKRPDIKTTQLLGPSLLKMKALTEAMDDVWFIKDGFITEGTSNNAFIVNRVGTLITRDLSSDILGGITRSSILNLAKKKKILVEERPFSLEEVYNASEAFITSSSIFIRSVVKVDNNLIGQGSPGTFVKNLIFEYLDYCKSDMT